MSDDTVFDIDTMMSGAAGGKEAAAPVIDFDSALVPLGDLFGRLEDYEFVIDPIIPANDATGLAGAGKTGKSSVALQMAVHVALGLGWRGMKVQRRPVVYLSGEDQRVVLTNRLKAYTQAWATSSIKGRLFDVEESKRAKFMAHLESRLKIADLRGKGWTLTRQSGGRAEVNDLHVEQLAAWVEALFPKVWHAPFIVFDTIGRYDEGAESNADYKLLVMALDRLQKRTGCTMLILAHTSQQATLEKRLDLTALRGGLHLANSVRSMLVMAGHRLGHKDDALMQQGAVPPMASDLIGSPFTTTAPLTVGERGERLSVLVHSDANMSATHKPLWFVRESFEGTGVLIPVEFMPDVQRHKDERAQRKAAAKEELDRLRLAKDCTAVLDFIRSRQDDPEVYLTKNYLRSKPATDAIGFGKDRLAAALEALGEALEVVDREDSRDRRNAVVQVYRAAP